MPNYTKNYNLEKPLETELYDVAVQNSNTDKIDTALKAVEDRVESTETSISLLDNPKPLKYVSTPTDANTTLEGKALILFSQNHPGGSGSAYFYFEQDFYGSVSTTSNRRQIATAYTNGRTWVRIFHNGNWWDWRPMTS